MTGKEALMIPSVGSSTVQITSLLEPLVAWVGPSAFSSAIRATVMPHILSCRLAWYVYDASTQETNMIPIVNIIVSANFLNKVIWSRQRTGSGVTITPTSRKRLSMPIASHSSYMLPHLPLIDLSQVYAKGRHVKKSISTPATA